MLSDWRGRCYVTCDCFQPVGVFGLPSSELVGRQLRVGHLGHDDLMSWQAHWIAERRIIITDVFDLTARSFFIFITASSLRSNRCS